MKQGVNGEMRTVGDGERKRGSGGNVPTVKAFHRAVHQRGWDVVKHEIQRHR